MAPLETLYMEEGRGKAWEGGDRRRKTWGEGSVDRSRKVWENVKETGRGVQVYSGKVRMEKVCEKGLWWDVAVL